MEFLLTIVFIVGFVLSKINLSLKKCDIINKLVIGLSTIVTFSILNDLFCQTCLDQINFFGRKIQYLDASFWKNASLGFKYQIESIYYFVCFIFLVNFLSNMPCDNKFYISLSKNSFIKNFLGIFLFGGVFWMLFFNFGAVEEISSLDEMGVARVFMFNYQIGIYLLVIAGIELSSIFSAYLRLLFYKLLWRFRSV